MALSNTGDPVQPSFNNADRVKPLANRRSVRKIRQKRRKTEESKRKSVAKLRPRKRG